MDHVGEGGGVVSVGPDNRIFTLVEFFRREYPTIGMGDQQEGHFPYDEGELIELAARIVKELEP